MSPASIRASAPAEVQQQLLPETDSVRLLPGLLLAPTRESKEEDVIGWYEMLDVHDPSRRVVVHDGATGDVLWERTLPYEGPMVDAPRAVLGDRLLVPTTSQRLAGLDLRTGVVAWLSSLSGTPRDYCQYGTVAGMRLSDGDIASLRLATGTPSALDGNRCRPVPTSSSVAPNFDLVGRNGLAELLPRTRPFQVVSALVPHQGKARVLLGWQEGSAEHEGAQLGVVVSRRWLWYAELGPTRNARARLPGTYCAVRHGRVVVAYELAPAAQLRIASFELASGRLAWDRALGDSRAWRRAELRISASHIIYFADGAGSLWALHADTGAIAWTIAPPQ